MTARTASERARASRARFRAEGGREIKVRLDAAASAQVDALADLLNMTITDIVVEAIACLARVSL